MVMVSRAGLIMPNMKATTNTERNTESELSNGVMALLTLVNSIIITSMEKVCILGPIIESTKENGDQIKCTEKVPSPGQMVVNTSASTSKIKNEDTVSSSGLMEDATEENGSMANNMAKELMLRHQDKKSTVSGKTEKE